jgi:hypothetical protein
MPNSEFSCFQGTLERSGELAMTVNSLGESATPNVASSSQPSAISDDAPITYAYSVALQDYHPLKLVSANDRKILQFCNQPQPEVYTKLVK